MQKVSTFTRTFNANKREAHLLTVAHFKVNNVVYSTCKQARMLQNNVQLHSKEIYLRDNETLETIANLFNSKDNVITVHALYSYNYSTKCTTMRYLINYNIAEDCYENVCMQLSEVFNVLQTLNARMREEELPEDFM